MTTALICSNCEHPIEEQYASTEAGYVHANRDICLKIIRGAPFLRAAAEIGKLLAEKNAVYGSSYAKCGDFLKLLYPAGIQPEQYTDMLLLARIFDKQMRIATAKDALGESPFRDIAGYGILGVVKDA